MRSPASAAVVSPPSFAAQACAASWKQVESRNAGYQNTSASTTAELTGLAISGSLASCVTGHRRSGVARAG